MTIKLKRRKFCACGCGKVVKKKWATGHHFNTGHTAWNKGLVLGKQSPEFIARRVAGRAGYRHSEEVKAKIKATNLKSWTNKELKQKHSLLMKDVRVNTLKKNPDKYKGFSGHKHSEEANEKNRQAHLGKVAWNKGRGVEITPPQFCKCGCNKMTKPGNQYIHGHANKGKGKIKVSQLCECGCREMTNPGKRYVRGHQSIGKDTWNKGIKMSKEFCDKVSEGLKGIPGRPCSDEVKEVLSQKSKELWKKPGHRERISESISGLKHPFYRNRPGLTLESLGREYPFDFNDKLKELIRDRDGRRCQLCTISEKEHGKKMHVHHIDYDKDNIDPDNLISLCTSCHGKTVINRDRWTNFFMGRYRIKRRKVA